jgi:hypothetical protein
LRNHGIGNDDVLWAVLFMLAVLVRDDSVVYGRASQALIGAGVFKVRWLVSTVFCTACGHLWHVRA